MILEGSFNFKFVLDFILVRTSVKALKSDVFYFTVSTMLDYTTLYRGVIQRIWRTQIMK